MAKRFVSIWFPYLETDWHLIRQPEKQLLPFVTAAPSHGKMMIVAVNAIAHRQGIVAGMSVADARAIFPSIGVVEHLSSVNEKLLKKIAEWCIRFSPMVSIDGNSGIILDATGCAHLWGGDDNYISEISLRFIQKGYNARLAMADTIGTAWALSHYGDPVTMVPPGKNADAISSLPPEALRLDGEITDVLHKLGLQMIGRFMNMPLSALRRRFGNEVINRLKQALGKEDELIISFKPFEPYQQRLTCLEPIVTAKGIEIALEKTLMDLCHQLQEEQKGLRSAKFLCYRVDGTVQEVRINTSHPSSHIQHLQKLFKEHLSSIEPREGIELFILEAGGVEDHAPKQESIWESANESEQKLAELVDRISSRIGADNIRRFIPDEHYWPERAYQKTKDLFKEQVVEWKTSKPRPVHLLSRPEQIEVTAPIPDYPPMLFRYKGNLHKIVKADGPERIEQEWWLQEGQHRDYYYVEVEDGNRYWLFRSGHYGSPSCKWFMHGFFA